MTKREQLASASRDNADVIGIGMPLILASLAEQYLGISLDTQTAMALAGVLGSIGAKIKRHI